MVMGILTDGINEVIATTRSNAAPMGIIARNGVYRIVCFNGSHTEKNIVRDRWVVANIVHDPVLFVRTAFSDLPETAFVQEDVDGTLMDRLADTEAWIAFSAVIEKRGTQSMTVRITPVVEKVLSCRPRPVNRGFSAIIEATVHGTRYRLSGNPDLKKLIDHYRSIIRKCGGSRELEALALFDSFIADEQGGHFTGEIPR